MEVRVGAVRPRSTGREDLLTVVFATWLVLGLFLDGWAHSNSKPESFFTPWHGVFYSGFLATAAWMIWVMQRRREAGPGAAAGPGGVAAIPAGYGLGLVGVGIFAFGGVFDIAWHQLFGIEVGVEALLSPSHLVLLAGGLLVTTTPLRAAWADPASRAPTFRQVLPALASITVATAAVAFFLMEFSPSLTNAMAPGPYRFASGALDPGVGGWLTDELRLHGYAAILLTTVVLMAPALLLSRRWTVPFGTFTVLFGAVWALVAAIESYDMGWTFLAGAGGGLAGDVLYQRLRPFPGTPNWRLWALAGAVPVVMWLAYFALLGLSFGVGWSAELWAGSTVMAGLAGLGLGILAAPPMIPES